MIKQENQLHSDCDKRRQQNTLFKAIDIVLHVLLLWKMALPVFLYLWKSQDGLASCQSHPLHQDLHYEASVRCPATPEVEVNHDFRTRFSLCFPWQSIMLLFRKHFIMIKFYFVVLASYEIWHYWNATQNPHTWTSHYVVLSLVNNSIMKLNCLYKTRIFMIITWLINPCNKQTLQVHF